MRFEPTVRPINPSKWPGGKENLNNEFRSPGRFRASYDDTKRLLADELDKAGADPATITLGMFVDNADVVRNGTRLYADRKPFHPGILLSFRRYGDTQEITYPCDAFETWQANLRALGLSMEKLRQVENYGVFKYADIIDRLALPSANGKITTRDAAASILARFSEYKSDQILVDPEIAKRAFRQAASKTHADKGGNVDDFQSVQTAKAVLFV